MHHLKRTDTHGRLFYVGLLGRQDLDCPTCSCEMEYL